MRFLLYGVANRWLRDSIAGYISDKDEVVGITDGIYDADILNQERFVPYAKIKEEAFDYLILCIEDNVKRNTVRKTLIDDGIESRKIIGPGILLFGRWGHMADIGDYVSDYYYDDRIRTVILGLSYSLRGIDSNRLGALDLSWHGQDLYYNSKQLNNLQLHRPDIYGSIDNLLLVFPMYYLNYDMSMSAYQFYTGQIYVNRSLKDYHNARKHVDNIITEYILSDIFFGERFWKGKSCAPYYGGSNEIIEKNKKEPLTEIWKNKHSKTIDENIKLFKMLISENKEKRIILVMPPILEDAIVESDLKYYYMMKAYFLKYTKECSGLEVVDCSNAVGDRECFVDYEHLNDKGKAHFTEYLQQMLNM